MAGQTPLTKGRSLGDVIRHVWHNGYNYVSGSLVNPDASARVGVNLLGQPVKASGNDFVLIKSSDEASAIGIVAEDLKVDLAISEVTLKKYLILRRGPALIDRDSLPVLDVAGGTLTPATIATALLALSPPIVFQTQPTVMSEQTT
jgi:hypothetical protein